MIVLMLFYFDIKDNSKQTAIKRPKIDMDFCPPKRTDYTVI